MKRCLTNFDVCNDLPMNASLRTRWLAPEEGASMTL